jgi:4-hydroxy-4-methyl-2-oxoglutarate aldolase
MIQDPPLLKVRRNFPRPDDAATRPLRHVPTGFVVDCMSGHGALDFHIKPLDPSTSKLFGTAITCHTGPDDNLAIFAAVEVSQPGDVLIVATDGFTGTAVTGDILLGMARNRGIAGFVTDGLVRDIDGILPVGLPTFCRGVTPNSCVRNGPGTVGLPVTMAGVTIDSGDIVIGDQDGVVIVPRTQLAQVCESLIGVKEAEADLSRQVRLGQLRPDSIREILASDRTQYLD